MKYFILINQQVLSETELDIIDGAILDYIYFYCNSQNEKVKKQRITDENEIWTWVDYSRLLEDMPMLKIKSIGAITSRVNKIENSGYIKTKRFQHMKKYFRMTAKSDGLFIQMNRAIHTNEQPYSSKRTIPIHINEPIKIKVNKDKKIKTKTIIAGKACGKETNLLIEKFKPINPTYERLFSNTTQRKVLERMVKQFTYEKVAGMIDALPEIVSQKYAPQISTPVQLENKLGQLLIFIKQNKKEEGYIQV